MRIVVNCPNAIARRAEQMVQNGDYASLDDLMTQALLRLVGTEPTASDSTPTAEIHQDGWDNRVGFASLPARSSVLVGEYVHSFAPGADWLWGMINRVFPLKVAARTCADLSTEGPVLLQSLHTAFADQGRRVGDLLTVSDRERGRRRNEALAVGFPVASDEQKARVRFAHQFIGRRSVAGMYVGGAFETGLVGVTEPGTDWVAPTPLGWQFANLHNLVLDEGIVTGQNLGELEREFYLCTVAAQIPAERNAFRAILGVLADEPLESATIAVRLRRYQNAALPETMRDTSRSGALARLADIGGIVRIATGRSAKYEITELGLSALRRLSSEATS